MISPEQEVLAFLKLELASCEHVVQQIKLNPMHKHEELTYWEKEQKNLLSRVFEIEVLLGVEV